MELEIEARFVLRLLLTTLLMLYGSTGAAGQTPGSNVGDTLVDDEDVNGRERSGIQFTLDMLSSVVDDSGQCFEKSLQEALKSQIKTKLVAALREDCKCQPSENLVDKDKLECITSSLIRYSGQISYWSSVTYPVKQLAEFIETWRAPIEVDGKEAGFALDDEFIFTFNITSSQVNYGGGSGDGADVDIMDFGSADITTIDLGGPDEEEEDVKDAGIASGLEGESGEQRSQVVGLLSVILCMTLAIAACFV